MIVMTGNVSTLRIDHGNVSTLRIDHALQRDLAAVRGVYSAYKDRIMKLIQEVEEKEHWV